MTEIWNVSRKPPIKVSAKKKKKARQFNSVRKQIDIRGTCLQNPQQRPRWHASDVKDPKPIIIPIPKSHYILTLRGFL